MSSVTKPPVSDLIFSAVPFTFAIEDKVLGSFVKNSILRQNRYELPIGDKIDAAFGIQQLALLGSELIYLPHLTLATNNQSLLNPHPMSHRIALLITGIDPMVAPTDRFSSEISRKRPYGYLSLCSGVSAAMKPLL